MQHEQALRDAINNKKFWEPIPEHIKLAINEGLMEEGDPTWQWSDAYGASNYAKLTKKGREFLTENGWLCKCKYCEFGIENEKYRGLAEPEEKYCPYCKGNIKFFKGMVEGSCKFHNMWNKKE